MCYSSSSPSILWIVIFIRCTLYALIGFGSFLHTSFLHINNQYYKWWSNLALSRDLFGSTYYQLRNLTLYIFNMLDSDSDIDISDLDYDIYSGPPPVLPDWHYANTPYLAIKLLSWPTEVSFNCQHSFWRCAAVDRCISTTAAVRSRVGRGSVVALRRTRLVPGWVTVCGRVNHIHM